MAKKNYRNKQAKNKTEINEDINKTLESKEINLNEHWEDLNNNINITPVPTQKKEEDNIQENNASIIPSSSREEVEVDKIFKLLQEAKDELKNKNNFKKDRTERMTKIIDDIPSKIAKVKEIILEEPLKEPLPLLKITKRCSPSSSFPM